MFSADQISRVRLALLEASTDKGCQIVDVGADASDHKVLNNQLTGEQAC